MTNCRLSEKENRLLFLLDGYLDLMIPGLRQTSSITLTISDKILFDKMKKKVEKSFWQRRMSPFWPGEMVSRGVSAPLGPVLYLAAGPAANLGK